MSSRIQAGIYFESGSKPPPAFQTLLLDIAPGTGPPEAVTALQRISSVFQRLKLGQLADLEGQPGGLAEASQQMFSEVDLLVGYGRRLFDDRVHNPPLIDATRPPYLSYIDPGGDPFPSLRWRPGEEANRGEADVLLQFTGPTSAAVNVAAVEIWKVIHDEDLTFVPAASFGGFGRADGRGWLDFHDGVSNMDSRERLLALEASEPSWMSGGTFMAFLRIDVDLTVWRGLRRSEQELLVGRDRLTGSALEAVDVDSKGNPIPRARPFSGDEASLEERAAWRDPPETTHRMLEASHIHRVNQSRASPGAPGALRMFRQGYEFLEDIRPEGPVLGLNFISFQSDLRTLHHVLHLPGWLGDANFGGSSEGHRGSPSFLTLAAAGFYAVPPREEPFPGVTLFRTAN